MRLWLVYFVVLPPKTLCDTHRPPFFLPQELQSALGLVMIVFGNGLEHSLGKLHVAVFVFVVIVASRC